jgi:hypothetical protein
MPYLPRSMEMKADGQSNAARPEEDSNTETPIGKGLLVIGSEPIDKHKDVAIIIFTACTLTRFPLLLVISEQVGRLRLSSRDERRQTPFLHVRPAHMRFHGKPFIL